MAHIHYHPTFQSHQPAQRGGGELSDPGITQLVQEDIEYIIQASAFDVDVPPAGTGYDDRTGFGRIDAGAALALIDRSFCNISHFGTDANDHDKNAELLEENVAINLTEAYTTESGQTFDMGSYTADVYKVTASVTHDLPSGYGVSHYWERHSSSTVFEHYDMGNNLHPVEHVVITGVPTASSANLEGYVYFLKNNTCSIQGWIPASPEDAELTYSLLGCSLTQTIEKLPKQLEVYPNPVSGLLSIDMPVAAEGKYSRLSIFNFSGKEVFTGSGPDFSDQINVAHLPPGIYAVSLLTGKSVFTGKFIKI